MTSIFRTAAHNAMAMDRNILWPPGCAPVPYATYIVNKRFSADANLKLMGRDVWYMICGRYIVEYMTLTPFTSMSQVSVVPEGL